VRFAFVILSDYLTVFLLSPPNELIAAILSNFLSCRSSNGKLSRAAFLLRPPMKLASPIRSKTLFCRPPNELYEPILSKRRLLKSELISALLSYGRRTRPFPTESTLSSSLSTDGFCTSRQSLDGCYCIEYMPPNASISSPDINLFIIKKNLLLIVSAANSEKNYRLNSHHT